MKRDNFQDQGFSPATTCLLCSKAAGRGPKFYSVDCRTLKENIGISSDIMTEATQAIHLERWGDSHHIPFQYPSCIPKDNNKVLSLEPLLQLVARCEHGGMNEPRFVDL